MRIGQAVQILNNETILETEKGYIVSPKFLRAAQVLLSYNPCQECGWYSNDTGCTCSSLELWYQCPLEPEPTAEDFE